MKVSVRPFVISLFAAFLAASAGLYAAKPLKQEVETRPAVENFFAGTVTVCTNEKITVSRVVLGKTEKRDFKLTADTKVEGKLKANVRVTVRYESGEEGDMAIATLIVIRANEPKKK